MCSLLIEFSFIALGQTFTTSAEVPKGSYRVPMTQQYALSFINISVTMVIFHTTDLSVAFASGG